MPNGRALLLVCSLFLLSTMPVGAQVNIERQRGQEDEPGLSGQFGLHFSLRTGNVRALDLGSGLRLHYIGQRFTGLVIGRGEIGFQGGERFSNGGLLHLREIYHFRPGMRLEAFGQWNYEKARRLDGRALAGAGLRIRLIERPRSSLWLGVGAMLEHERNAVPPAARHPAETTLARLTSYLAARLEVSSRATFVATGYYQPYLRDAGDRRLLLDASFRVSVTENTSLTNTATLLHDSRPVDGVVRTDFRLRTSITFTF